MRGENRDTMNELRIMYINRLVIYSGKVAGRRDLAGAGYAATFYSYTKQVSAGN